VHISLKIKILAVRSACTSYLAEGSLGIVFKMKNKEIAPKYGIAITLSQQGVPVILSFQLGK